MPSLTEFMGIDDRYFPTMGLHISRGRNFLQTDTATAPLVGIVSESLGRFVANGGDPIGHRIAEFFNTPGQPPNTVEIVGMVPDVIARVTTLEPLVLYRPLAQVRPDTSRTVLVHAAGRPSVVAREMLATIERLDPTVRVAPLRTMDEQLLAQMQPQRFGMLVLSALGETVRLVSIGIAVGFGLAWLFADTVRALLYQIELLDPLNLASVAVAIVVLALAVSLRPALLAARVDLARMIREP